MIPLVFLALAAAWPLETKSLPPGDDIVALAETENAADDSKLVAAVGRLKELGIVTDTEYWETNARKGHTCDGEMVAELLIATASKYQPTDNLDSAVRVLKDNNILQNKEATEYWEKKAVAGAKCPGRFVGLILVKISEVL